MDQRRQPSTFSHGVRSIWSRHKLACFKERLKALEAKVAADGIILTESQVAALERKKLNDESSGEIDAAQPGYLGSQDTFYVRTFKGVGRVYQQTYVDTYAKVAHAKLYTTKTPITELLQVIASIEDPAVIKRILDHLENRPESPQPVSHPVRAPPATSELD